MCVEECCTIVVVIITVTITHLYVHLIVPEVSLVLL